MNFITKSATALALFCSTTAAMQDANNVNREQVCREMIAIYENQKSKGFPDYVVDKPEDFEAFLNYQINPTVDYNTRECMNVYFQRQIAETPLDGLPQLENLIRKAEKERKITFEQLQSLLKELKLLENEGCFKEWKELWKKLTFTDLGNQNHRWYPLMSKYKGVKWGIVKFETDGFFGGWTVQFSYPNIEQIRKNDYREIYNALKHLLNIFPEDFTILDENNNQMNYDKKKWKLWFFSDDFWLH